MKKLSVFIMAVMCAAATFADTYIYSFDSIRLADAFARVADEHPSLNLNFIYDELDNYIISADINTSDAYVALRQIVGLNPVSIIRKGDCYYAEALQKGKFIYTGRAVENDSEPIAAATVMLLASKDSTVITYGMTDENGRFSIPCDKKRVIAKLTCVGYAPTFHFCREFNLGTIVMTRLPIALNTITVEADNISVSTDKTVYRPTRQQKQVSQTAIKLLYLMAIPSLIVDPDGEKVTDVHGNTCTIFINYVPATSEDLTSMKVTDVRRIEYLEYPTDPRFRGAGKVINMIVQEYEYGGYTKASATETCFNGYSSRYDIFSKFVFKKMTYDLFAGARNSSTHHSGSDIKARYSFANGNDVVRTETLEESHEKKNVFPVTFRASFNTEKFQLRQLLSFTHSSTPVAYQSGRLEYGIIPQSGYIYSSSTPNRYNNINCNGNLYWMLPEDISVNYNYLFIYTHRNEQSVYYESIGGSEIRNPADEDAFQYRSDITCEKAAGKKHRFAFNGRFAAHQNKLLYLNNKGSDNNFRDIFGGAWLRYSYRSDKLRLGIESGFGFESIKVNGTESDDIYPYTHLNVQYIFSKKSSLSSSLYYYTTTPGIGMRTDEIVRSNELLYLSGNPLLKNYRNATVNLSYNWMPVNRLSFAAFTGYSGELNRVATVYDFCQDGNALIRSFINNGNYMNYYLGLSGNLRLFNNSLQLYANVCQNFYKTSGIYETSLSHFRIQLQASYYWKNFYALVAWANPQRTLTENSNIKIRYSSNYVIEGGWGNGKLNVSLSAKNIFRKNWESSVWESDTPLYQELKTVYSPHAHANMQLTVSYTFGYGKKIRRGNEIGGQENAESAIIH